MSTLPIWQVDAFTDQLFAGNPAAVVMLEQWLPDAVLLSIAAENNLAETAFVVAKGEGAYALRWFTPTTEVPLCGHATLASAHVLWTEGGVTADQLRFETLSGELRVEREAGGYSMDFPTQSSQRISDCAELTAALGVTPTELWASGYLIAVLPDADAVRTATPNFHALEMLSPKPEWNGAIEVVITASGEGDVDFVSRFFAPTIGVPEDPVTGSAHCILAPFWANRLGKTDLRGYQASSRGGVVSCTLKGERVILGGNAVTYLRGQIRVPSPAA